MFISVYTVTIHTAPKEVYYHAGTSSKIYLTLLGAGDTPVTHETYLKMALKTGGKATAFIGSEVQDAEVKCVQFRMVGSDGWIMQQVGEKYNLIFLI